MEELMKQRIWIVWRKEANGDRITKVPFAASGGATGTNEKYRHTWVTYDEAVEAAKKVGAIYEEFRKKQDEAYISEFDRQTEKYLKGE